MEGFLIQLGTMSLQAAIIILVVCLIRALLIKGRVSQKYVILLWIVPFFFMVFPWKVSSPVGFWREYKVMEQTIAPQTAAERVVADNEFIDTIGKDDVQKEEVQNEQVQNEQVQNGQVENATMSYDKPMQPELEGHEPRDIVVQILFAAWMTGVLAVLGYMLLSALRLRKRLACSVCEEGNIYLAEDIAVPMVLGIIRPRIYLPTGMEEVERSFVISHEQTHIMRKDPINKLLAFIIVGVHWFNPLAWVAFLLLERDMEMACDEETVRRMGEASKKAYAATLLWISAEKGAGNYRVGVPLGFGEVDIRQRIKNILVDKRTMQIGAVAVICVCVVLTAVFLTKQEAAEEAAKQGSAQLMNEIPEVAVNAAESYAREHFERVWEEYSKWRVTEVIHTYTYDDFYGMKLQVYRFHYEFLAIHPESIVLAGGMSMDEEGWVVPGYPDSVYLIFEERGGEMIHLTTMMENDCEPGDEVFNNDLEHKLLDTGVKNIPAKSIDIIRRSITADMMYTADGVDLNYADEKRLIMKDGYALYVYDLKKGRMHRQIDVTAIGCNYTQGDFYCDVQVSQDGSLVYLHPIHLSSMYVYDIEKDTLIKTVYEAPKDVWKGYLMRSDYIGNDFTVFQSLFCVEVSQGAYGYLQGGTGLVADTAWVVRDANGKESFTYLFKKDIEQQAQLPNTEPGADFTMEMLIELVEGGNTYDVFQQLVSRNRDVYQNFVREDSEYSLTWSYFCNMTYMDKEYRLQIAYWKPEEASKYAKSSNALSEINLVEVASGDTILLYDEEGRFRANTDIREFLDG